MKKIIYLVSLLFLLGACSSENSNSSSSESPSTEAESNSGEELVLNAVSFLSKDHPLTATIQDWIDQVEEGTEGRVKVNWRGGADVIPVGEQFEALNSGVIDINFTYIGQYQSLAPESLSIALSQAQPWEERENGFYDFMVERHKLLDTMYIGRWLTGSPRIWLNEPISSVDDFSSITLRSAPNYNRLFDEMGVNSAMIDPSEVYTSLQTGIVDGFVYGGLSGPRTDGWTDSTKYVLDHPFWTQNCTILMNLEKWDQISTTDQEAILAATAEYERYMVDYYEELDKEERVALEEAGVEFFEFSEEEKEKFLDLAYEVEWDYLVQETPELIEKMRELTGN
ncbi:TRAP transporter substrate-binding protein DctP [Alkalihalobacillus sp. MEB130]|uniref:TRAP transporter substrate-binding protein DctP n=1 Tax=Alkalihalobacillus sp. MEB130 TaxID=2976704 RepID=UPI0028DE610D|nr:TRAP transporter substrate-binding protein DctP [Alkalihalobacillus sp. MEB130]MDT8860733.1 TRAP transporter substrate-binding protein DctP [Alkalihalobacillus sp. MEB130]